MEWLLARRVGRVEARLFFEELDELHGVKLRTEGEEAGNDWRKKELRRALVVGLAGLFSRRGRSALPDGGDWGTKDAGPVDSYRFGPVALVSGLVRDLRFGLRTIRKRPLFAALVVGTLGLGIGASTTVYSLVDGVLVKDLAYERPGELVAIWGAFPEWRDDPLLQEAWDKIGLTWDGYLALRDRAESFSGIAGHRSSTLTLTGAGDPVRLETAEATANLFQVLGIRPFLGRTFLPGEEGPGAPRVAVLGHDLWRSRFGSDSTLVGASVMLNGQPFEVIGILPPKVRVHSKLYSLFNSAIDEGERAVWVPANWNRAGADGSQDLETIGRLRPGVPRAQALAEVKRLMGENQRHETLEMRLTSPRDEIVAGYRSPLFLLMAASGILLLIACGNAATLLLGEAIDRRGEISTRIAMGAGRSRIAQQLLAESLILGLGGSLVGMLLTPLGIRAFLALGPTLPRLQDVEVDQGILLAAGLTGVVCAVVFGFAPAFLQHRQSLYALLQREGRGRLGGGGRVQSALVGGELALTMVLLVTAGVLSRSLMELQRVDPGFQAQGVATVRALISSSTFGSDQAARAAGARAFQGAVLERVEAIPGVVASGAIDGLPFPGLISGTGYLPQGNGADESKTVMARSRGVSRGYFEAMGIPLLTGRLFEDGDEVEGAAPVVLINETMARRYWPGTSPLGASVRRAETFYRIVGIVGDVRERHPSEEPLPMVYHPLSSMSGSFSIVARRSGEPERLVPALRKVIRDVNADVPVTQESTMETLVRASSGAERFRAFLVGAFGFLATFLALVGVFGVTARSVAHRNREMGIRMALGAESRGLVRMVTLGTLRTGAAGIGLGLLGALVGARFLSAFAFGTEAWDAWTYSGAVLILGLLSAAAAALAAHRVTRVEPMQVLREE